MFGDENKDVRMTIARTAARFIEAVGGDGLNTFLPLFKKSIDDDKWRVRLEGYEALIILAKNFDGVKNYKNLKNILRTRINLEIILSHCS